MNLRSKSRKNFLNQLFVSHYRGPFILVGADAPAGLPCGAWLSYQVLLVPCENFEQLKINDGYRASQ
jgi:hypothetical protein